MCVETHDNVVPFSKAENSEKATRGRRLSESFSSRARKFSSKHNSINDFRIRKGKKKKKTFPIFTDSALNIAVNISLRPTHTRVVH